MVHTPVHTRRRVLRDLGLSATALAGVGSVSAEEETFEGEILTVDPGGDTGTLERVSDGDVFDFREDDNVDLELDPGDRVLFELVNDVQVRVALVVGKVPDIKHPQPGDS